MATLNIPIRQRVDVPQVIPVSVSKWVLKRVLPPTPKEAFSPEPALPDESYEVNSSDFAKHGSDDGTKSVGFPANKGG